MTISSQRLCFEARRKCGVGFIHTQLASSHANAPQKLAISPSTVGFINRDFHALISRQHSQTNRRGLYTHVVPNIKISVYAKNQLCRCPTYHTKRAALIRSLRRRPYRMKLTAVGFISLTTVITWHNPAVSSFFQTFVVTLYLLFLTGVQTAMKIASVDDSFLSCIVRDFPRLPCSPNWCGWFFCLLSIYASVT